jgi:6-phosphogluconolactonase
MTLPPGERVSAEPAREGLPAPDIVIEPDADRLARAVASALVARLAAAQAVHGTASVVLTGGGIGIAVLERVAALAAEPERERVDWTAVDVWWGDERFVPADSAERNELSARRALLDPVGVPAERVHAMPASDAGFALPEDAAGWYAGQLAAAAEDGPLPRFDVLLLGMGPEGHVASIFPDSPAARDERPVFAVRDCPKPPQTRISLGFSAINTAEEVWLVVTGEGKADAVARAVTGAASAVELPAAGVHGRRATRWLLDAAAAGRLPRPNWTLGRVSPRGGPGAG